MMGLDIYIKGMDRKETYHDSYGSFRYYREAVATAYDKDFGELYKKWYQIPNYNITIEEETDLLFKINNVNLGGLDIFLAHSDDEGKLKPKDCKLIYNAMKDLVFEKENLNFRIECIDEIHQIWLKMLKYCYQKRKTLYFC